MATDVPAEPVPEVAEPAPDVAAEVVEPAEPDDVVEAAAEPDESVETVAAPAEPVAAETLDDAGPDDTEPTDDTASAEDTEPAEDTESAEPILVAHRPAGRVLKTAAVFAAVLVVAAAAFAGAVIQRYVLDRAEVHVKLDIAKTAADAITTLWTYTPDDLEQLPQRSSQYLSGDFAADYKRYIDAIVAPNKQAQVSNQTQVLGAAVESVSANEATAIVYTNSVSTSPVTKGIPSLRYLSYRLDMKRAERRWLINQMVAVTKLDLTPRL